LFLKFTSGGLHEKHVVATWKHGNHLSICLKDTGKPRKPVTRWPVAGPSEHWLLASSPASKVNTSIHQFDHSLPSSAEVKNEWSHTSTVLSVSWQVIGWTSLFFHWHNPSGRTKVLGSTQPLTEMSTRCIPGGKGGRCVRLTNLPPSCAVVMKSGNLNFLGPSGPLQACNGTALPYLLLHVFYLPNCSLLWPCATPDRVQEAESSGRFASDVECKGF
jgi:hypothetical protein